MKLKGLPLVAETLFLIRTFKITQKFNNSENFFIDTSIFRNIGGIGDTSYSYKIKSKRGTKVSILVDSKGNPLSIHCVSANVSDICLVRTQKICVSLRSVRYAHIYNKLKIL